MTPSGAVPSAGWQDAVPESMSVLHTPFLAEDSSASLTLTSANVMMTPQGQVLTLKNPLVPGQVAAVPSTLLQAELKPRGAGNTMTTQPGRITWDDVYHYNAVHRCAEQFMKLLNLALMLQIFFYNLTEVELDSDKGD